MKASACAMVVSLILAVASCKKSPTAPSTGGLPGTWRATSAEFVDRADPARRVELVSRGGTIVLVLAAGGTFTLTTTTPGAAAETATGTWTSSRDVLTLRPSAVTGDTQFDYTLSGDTLTLAGGHVLFDVNGDDRDDEAELSMTLRRE
jgi:hypothetical protein